MIRRYARLVKRALSDYRWFLYYMQRLTLAPRCRQQVASLAALLLPRTRPLRLSPEGETSAKELREDGIAFLPRLLTASQVHEMIEYLTTQFCCDPRHPDIPGFRHPREAPRTCFHAYYRPEDIIRMPHLLALANHPSVLGTVEALFGCKPTLSNIGIWWLLKGYDFSDENGSYFRRNAGNLHRDVDDWAQLKLFVYLTDVDTGSAPHLFLRGSHRNRIAPARRNLSVEAANRCYPGRLVTITGPAGMAWLENTFGLHVGGLPETNDRLMLAISYTLFPLPFQRIARSLAPELHPCPYDPYINRFWVSAPTVRGTARPKNYLRTCLTLPFAGVAPPPRKAAHPCANGSSVLTAWRGPASASSAPPAPAP